MGIGSGKTAGILNCLIVCLDKKRQALLTHTATHSGWGVTSCADAEQARLASRRIAYQMAIVDMAVPDRSELTRDLCQDLVRDKHVLLVVCGKDGVPEEEIRARQLGAWVYLPGTISAEGLSDICRQAQEFADKVELID